MLGFPVSMAIKNRKGNLGEMVQWGSRAGLDCREHVAYLVNKVLRKTLDRRGKGDHGLQGAQRFMGQKGARGI